MQHTMQESLVWNCMSISVTDAKKEEETELPIGYPARLLWKPGSTLSVPSFCDKRRDIIMRG